MMHVGAFSRTHLTTTTSLSSTPEQRIRVMARRSSSGVNGKGSHVTVQAYCYIHHHCHHHLHHWYNTHTEGCCIFSSRCYCYCCCKVTLLSHTECVVFAQRSLLSMHLPNDRCTGYFIPPTGRAGMNNEYGLRYDNR